MSPILGYWNLRGRAQSIRYLLHYTDTEFVDKRYELPLNLVGKEWLKDKFNLGLDVPNLPYWIEGSFKMTQSLAILRHLARKHGLVDDSSEEQLAKSDMFELQCEDLHMSMRTLVVSPNFEIEYPDFVRELPEKLKPFSAYMGNHPWLLGDKLTYVDFYLFELLDRLKELVPGCLEEFENLAAYHQRFEALPNIARYRQSKEFSKWPIYAPIAKFGGSTQPSVIKIVPK